MSFSTTTGGTVSVVTDALPLQEAVVRAIRAVASDIPVTSMLYNECPAMLTAARVGGTTLFVVELLRNYPGGVRAEGVALADQLLSRRKPTLILSPLVLPHVQGEGYWDTAASDTLSDRVRRLLAVAGRLWPVPQELRAAVAHLMALPPQHDR